MKNQKVRDAMHHYGIPEWQLAEILNMKPSVLCEYLSEELPDKIQDTIETRIKNAMQRDGVKSKSIFEASEEEKRIEREWYDMLKCFHEICKPEIQWGGCEYQKDDMCVINGDKRAFKARCNSCTYYSPTRDNLKKNIVEGFKKNQNEIADLKKTVKDYAHTISTLRDQVKSFEKQTKILNELIDKHEGFIQRLLFFVGSMKKNKALESFLDKEGYKLPKEEEKKGEENVNSI